jgi:hypothetical protein
MRRGIVRIFGITLVAFGLLLSSYPFFFGRLYVLSFAAGLLLIGFGIWLNVVPIRNRPGERQSRDTA